MNPVPPSSVIAEEVRSMAHGIVSAGYEGRTLEEFVPALQRAGVQTVADVRYDAGSGRTGFSKPRLHVAFDAAKIMYRHLPALGRDPANAIWDRHRRVADTVYRQFLDLPAAQIALHEIAYLAGDQVVAVFCSERDVRHCHRRIVIDEVLKLIRVPVVELPGPSPSHRGG